MSDDPKSDQFCAALKPAFQALLTASDYAVDTGSDRWDFAVSIHELANLGFTETDLRWLVRKRFVEHASEITSQAQNGRSFRAAGELSFSHQSCFVLTEAGLSKARSLADSTPLPSYFLLPDGNAPIGKSIKGRSQNGLQQPVPHWDGQRRELSFGGTIVKRYKWQAINQEIVLSAFEEDGWPPVIDDPLPPEPEQDPKLRLQNTIKALNRKQERALIRFVGNGTGAGVKWTLVSS